LPKPIFTTISKQPKSSRPGCRDPIRIGGTKIGLGENIDLFGQGLKKIWAYLNELAFL